MSLVLFASSSSFFSFCFFVFVFPASSEICLLRCRLSFFSSFYLPLLLLWVFVFVCFFVFVFRRFFSGNLFTEMSLVVFSSLYLLLLFLFFVLFVCLFLFRAKLVCVWWGGGGGGGGGQTNFNLVKKGGVIFERGDWG